AADHRAHERPWLPPVDARHHPHGERDLPGARRLAPLAGLARLTDDARRLRLPFWPRTSDGVSRAKPIQLIEDGRPGRWVSLRETRVEQEQRLSIVTHPASFPQFSVGFRWQVSHKRAEKPSL